MLVGDYWNYRVTQWNLNGTPTGDGVFLGNRGFGAQQNQTIYGIAVDPLTGNVFTAEADRQLMTMYSPTGQFLVRWGGNGNGPGKFLYPRSVAVSSEGLVYVADMWGNANIVVQNVTRTPPYVVTELFQFGSTGSGNGQFKQPRGIAFDSQDNLFVADHGNKRIVVFDKTGRYLRSFGQGTITGNVRGLALDNDNGWVYLVDAAANRVRKYTQAGQLLLSFGAHGTGNGQFVDGGRDVAVDAQHNVWVADMPNFRVQKFSPNGQWLMTAPTPAAPPPDGGFNGPRGVAVGPDGSTYVTDTYNWRVQRFNSSGNFLSTWGRRGSGPYAYNYSRLIAADRRNGDVALVDTDNHQVKKYTQAGVHLFTVDGFAVGGFLNPHGIEIDQSGLIYVADSRNSRVVVLSASGTVLRTFATGGYPRGITVDPGGGDIFVADANRDTVTRYSSVGIPLGQVYGGPGTGESSLDGPFDVAVDATRLFVADSARHRIKVYDKATGALLESFGGKGTGPGRLSFPQGLDLRDGHLYVSEQGNDRIQVFRV